MCSFAARVAFGGATVGLPAPDVIVGSTVHPLAALAAAIIARRLNVPFVFEVRDLWPQTLIDFGKISATGLTARTLRKLESWLFRSASKTVVLLPRAADYVVNAGVDATRVAWIPNGVEVAEDPIAADTQSSAHDGTGFKLMYFGAVGEANGLDYLVRAMKEVQARNPSVTLRIIGDGPQKPTLIQLAQSLALSNISFEKSIPKTQIPRTAEKADAFVLCVRNLPGLYRFGISMNKLYDYMAAGRPVIIASAAANNPVREANAGITIAPDDESALAEGILDLAQRSVEERSVMGRSGRAFVESHHSYASLAKRFSDVLNEVIRTGDAKPNPMHTAP